MRKGSRSLGEFHLDLVRIECERRGRSGSYGRDRLLERFGPDIALPDLLLVELASCDRRKNYTRPCGVRYMDLASRR
jgi:hypothetical protein